MLLHSPQFCLPLYSIFFFFNDTATTEIYTLSLHDALPIWIRRIRAEQVLEALKKEPLRLAPGAEEAASEHALLLLDRKSTRLNSSHGYISYAVFCLKKKKNKEATTTHANTSDVDATPPCTH